MKKIEDLKSGDIFFEANHAQIKSYMFVCQHPTNKGYYILLNDNKDPIKLYYSELDKILKKELNTFEEAQKVHIQELISYVEEYINN